MTVDIGSNGAISKDNQIIGVRAVIYWKYDTSKIYTAATQWSSERIEQQLKVTSIEAIKTTIGLYTVFDLAANQTAISERILSQVQAKINAVNMPIEITTASVTNFDWSPEFDQQIQATMSMAQQVRQAEQAANRAEQEQRQLAITAEAQARARVAEAQGEKDAAQLRADALLIEANAVAEANRLRSQPASLQYQQALWRHDEEMKRLEKWNGVDHSTYIPMLPPGYSAPAGANSAR